MQKSKALSLFILVLFIGLSATVFAAGQQEDVAEDFPNRSIELIVPMGAGGSHDMHSRAITSVISEYLGVPMTVTLRPGGSGVIGTKEVADAKKDGYTLLLGGTGPNTALPFIQETGYSQDSFTPIAKINHAPVVFVVNGDSPFKTMDDLINYIKNNPGELDYASGGPFGNLHIPLVQLWEAAGVYGDVEHIPFDGGGPAIVALLANDVDVSAAFPGVLTEHLEAGTLRALGVASTERLDGVFADVPTLQELGYDVVFEMWRAVLAPADIPKEVEKKLRDAFAQLVEDATFQKLLKQMGERTDLYLDGPDFRESWDKEISTLKPILELMKREEG